MRPTGEDSSRTVRLEAFEVLGRWYVRLVVTQTEPEGLVGEPYVFTTEFRTLDLVGNSWQALSVLDETRRSLDAAVRDGYE